MSADPFKLGTWTRSQARAAVFRLALVSKLEGGDELSPIAEWPTPADEVARADFVESVLEQATADAGAFPGRVCTYVVVALDAAERIFASRRFTVRGEDRGAITGSPSESPSAHGLLAQMMRHNEAMAALNVQAKIGLMTDARELVQLQADVMKDLRADIATLRAREELVARLQVQLQGDAAGHELKKLELETGAKASAEGKARFWNIAQPLILKQLGAPSPTLPPSAPPGEVHDPLVANMVREIVMNQVDLGPLLKDSPPAVQQAVAAAISKYVPAIPPGSQPPTPATKESN